jgi:predicted glutamine amidotransferase
MCVIVHRPAQVSFDFEKMKVACQKNADGFGLMFSDRGKLEIIREFDPGKNDPEKVLRYMEDAKDHDLFLHLRLRSVGDKGLDNCHPFVIYEDGDTKFALMHNGTMGTFDRRDGKTDSETFGREMILPLILRFQTENGLPLLNDPLFREFAQRLVPNTSRIALMDNEGNSLILNKKEGAEVDGCWASNEYSFRNYAAASSSYYEGYRGAGSSRWNKDTRGWETWDNKTQKWVPEKEASGSVVPLKSGGTEKSTVPFVQGTNRSDTSAASTTPGGQTSKEGAKKSTSVEPTPERTGGIKVVNPLAIDNEARPTFKELAQLESLSDISFWTAQDFKELIEDFPAEAIILFLDLVERIWGEGGDEPDDDDGPDGVDTKDPACYSVVEG